MAKGVKKTRITKAVASLGGFEIAKDIWIKELSLHQTNFIKAPTEKELSMRTWIGCTSKEFDDNTGFYKHLNTSLMKYIKARMKSAPIERIRSDLPDGSRVSKICKANKKHAIAKQQHLAAMASGCIASAMEKDERHKLGSNVGAMVWKGVQAKVAEIPKLTAERKEEMVKELVIEQAYEAGRQFGTKEIASEIIDMFEDRPALIACDQKYAEQFGEQDKLSHEANKRREKRKKKSAIQEVEVPSQ
jgi:hypothetical protein